MWKSGMRSSTPVIISENVTRAKCEPGQRWMPTPNDTWRLGLRSTTKVSASGNSDSSRPAATSLNSTSSPCFMVTPPNSVSVATTRLCARRRIEAQELLGGEREQRRVVEQALPVGRELGQVEQRTARQCGRGVDA